MKMKMFVLVTSLVATASGARAECTAITSLPQTIAAPGQYCLVGDLTFTAGNGSAILIEASDVVVDLNGHVLENVAGSSTSAYGISALHRRNVTIRNGTVRRFQRAVSLWADNLNQSWGHRVENLHVDRCTGSGIVVRGGASVISRNVVSETGSAVAGSPVAIGMAGPGSRVIDNDVAVVRTTGNGISIGISLTNMGGGMVINNRVTGALYGIQFSLSNGAKYRDNLTTDVDTPYIGGIDAGNNN
jgi:hypothetical protein